MISIITPVIESDFEDYWHCHKSVIDEILENGEKTDEFIVVVKLEKTSEKDFRERLKEKYEELYSEIDDIYSSVVKYEFSDGNRSVAKNFGLSLAKNDIITFLDYDTAINRGFLKATKKAFEGGYAYINYSSRPLDEEVADEIRLFFYARFMNFNQLLYTLLGIYKPYGFGMSVRKDFSEDVAENGEVFLKILAGHGEDAEFGGRYGKHCNERGMRGKYEKVTIVKTSFREWYKRGLFGAGVRMIRNIVEAPRRKRPVVSNWR